MVRMAPVVYVLIPDQRHLHLSSFIQFFPWSPTPHTHATKTKKFGLGRELLSQRSLILIQLLQMNEHRIKSVLPVSY